MVQGKGFNTDAPVEVCVQGTGHACQKTGKTKGIDLGETRVHAHGIGGPVVITDGNQAAAISGTQQIAHEKC